MTIKIPYEIKILVIFTAVFLLPLGCALYYHKWLYALGFVFACAGAAFTNYVNK